MDVHDNIQNHPVIGYFHRGGEYAGIGNKKLIEYLNEADGQMVPGSNMAQGTKLDKLKIPVSGTYNH